MATNRADILSRTFTLPEQPTQEVGRAGGAGRGSATDYNSDYFGIPKPAEGLQWTNNVSELSNRYYQKLSALDQYAKSMWLNNKIDVTRPDYSNQQAVLAAQAYQQELGNIMSLADELKVSQKELEADRAIQRTGKGRFGEQAFAEDSTYASQIPGADKFYSTEVDPSLQFQEKGLNRSFDTGTDYNRANQEALQVVDYWKTRYDQTRDPQDLIQYQAAQSLIPAYNVQSQGGSGSGYAGRSIMNNADLLGGGDPTYSEINKLDSAGKKIRRSISNDFIGIPLGKGLVTSVDRKNGKTYLVNDKGGEEEVRGDNIYKYLQMAAKKVGLEKELEMEFLKLVQENKVKWDKTKLTYVPKGISVEDLMTDLGKETKQIQESGQEDLSQQRDQVVNDINTKFQQVSDFGKLGWWDRADTGLGIMGQEKPEVLITTANSLYDLKVVPSPFKEGKEGKITITVVDKSERPVTVIGDKKLQPSYVFDTVEEAKEWAIKNFSIIDAGIFSPKKQAGGAQTTFEQPITQPVKPKSKFLP